MQRMQFLRLTLCVSGISLLVGCSSQRPVNMAPPLNNGQMMPQSNNMAPNMAPPVNQMSQAQPGGGVYQWQEVPQGQQVPIQRATFDQGGYQIFAQSGETIVVPFVNQNLYAMKFGRTSGQSYFVNNGDAPILYLAPGSYLENAAAQNARWYPIPDNYNYSSPMYVTLAPSWNDYTAMGWYPGMNYYGGMWSYNPYSFHWMPGFYISIGGARYTDWGGYHSYYLRTPGYVRTTTIYRNYNTARGSYGHFGSTRSANYSSGFGGRATRSNGSFGGFGNPAARSNGSFGGGRTTITPPTSRPFGGAPTGSSFGNGNSSRPFGGGRSSSSSFGGGRTTGGSFGGGGRSSGGSFGGSRRR